MDRTSRADRPETAFLIASLLVTTSARAAPDRVQQHISVAGLGENGDGAGLEHAPADILFPVVHGHDRVGVEEGVPAHLMDLLLARRP
jgi:hypothetical protein